MIQDPPESFPQELVEKVTIDNKEIPKVRACKLSFEMLKQAVTLTHNNFVEKMGQKDMYGLPQPTLFQHELKTINHGLRQ